MEVLPWRCPKVCFLQDKGSIHRRYGQQEEVPTVVCRDHPSPRSRHNPDRCDEVSHDPSPMCHIWDEYCRLLLDDRAADYSTTADSHREGLRRHYDQQQRTNVDDNLYNFSAATDLAKKLIERESEAGSRKSSPQEIP